MDTLLDQIRDAFVAKAASAGYRLPSRCDLLITNVRGEGELIWRPALVLDVGLQHHLALRKGSEMVEWSPDEYLRVVLKEKIVESRPTVTRYYRVQLRIQADQGVEVLGVARRKRAFIDPGKLEGEDQDVLAFLGCDGPQHQIRLPWEALQPALAMLPDVTIAEPGRGRDPWMTMPVPVLVRKSRRVLRKDAKGFLVEGHSADLDGVRELCERLDVDPGDLALACIEAIAVSPPFRLHWKGKVRRHIVYKGIQDMVVNNTQRPVYVLEERLRQHRDRMKEGAGFENWRWDEGTAVLVDETGHIVMRIVLRSGRMHVVSELSGSEVTVMMPMMGIAHQVHDMVVAHSISEKL